MMRSTAEHFLLSPFPSPSPVQISYVPAHYTTAPSLSSTSLSIDEMEVCDVMENIRLPPKLFVEDFNVYEIRNPFHTSSDDFPLNTNSNYLNNNVHANNIHKNTKPSLPTSRNFGDKNLSVDNSSKKTVKSTNNNSKVTLNLSSSALNSNTTKINNNNNAGKGLNEASAVSLLSSFKSNVNHNSSAVSLINNNNNNNTNLNNNNNNNSTINNVNNNREKDEEMKEGNILSTSRLDDLNGIKVPYSIKMYKRLNGNQPWVESHISPPMIGKMRKVVIEFESIPSPIQLRVYIKQICSKGNQSTLVISESNRIYKKTQKGEGCDSASYVIEASPQPQSKTLYLKPCWVCFGPRKDRPEFQVIISVTDLRTNITEILHSWNTEIHCHKMESSLKGKSMETSCPPSSLDSAFYL